MAMIDNKAIADCVARFRGRKPHVHHITNSVAEYFTANVILAAGGTPSMTIALDEVKDFVDMADGLLINLGTMDDKRKIAIETAARHAQETNKTWGLDPVFVQASAGRLAMARQLFSYKPSLLRANSLEAQALLGDQLDIESGLETGFETGAADFIPHGCTLAVTGKVDRIINQQGMIGVCNGSPLMSRSTAMGCALTALIVGFMAIEDNHLLAVTAAIAYYNLAGELAERSADGPGTFVPLFLDALASLASEQIMSGVSLL